MARRDRQGRSQCAQCARRDDPDQYPAAVLAHLARLDTGLDEATLEEVLRQAAPKPFAVRRLANELEAIPSLLTGDGARGSAHLVTLLELLNKLGARNAVVPPCPWCGRAVRLTTTHGGLRSCSWCPQRLRVERCSACGEERRVYGRSHDGQRLCRSCHSRDPSNHAPCSRCGRTGEVRQTGDHAGVCFACERLPVALCSVCGRMTPCYRADTDAPRCLECSHRHEECSGCGRRRRVVTRTAEGEPLCGSCHVIIKTCARCGHETRVNTRRTSGDAVCDPCYRNDPARRQPCPGCGTIAIPARHGLCETCAAPDRLRELLGDDHGIVAPVLEPVFRALAGGKPSSVLEWLNRPGRAALLSQIRNTGMPVTHGMLDQLTPADRTRQLRMILVATHVLPERDEQLAALERWVSQFLKNTTDPVERRLLHAFVTWHYLRRLRRKHHPGRPLSPHTAANVRYCLAQSAQFLQWLREHGAPLAACSQHDIDTWLAEGTVMRFKARGFVRWAARHNHIRRPVTFPPMPSGRPYRTLPDDADRWRLVHRFLHDDSIAAVDRVAGLLVLLYGQPLTKIAALTTDQVLTTDEGIRLALGPHPVTVPPPLDQLLIHLAEDRDGALALGRSTDHSWLLPGTHPGRPRSPRQLRTRLASYGLPSRRGRNSALMDLAAQMPPAVLSEVLGVSIGAATGWAAAAGGPRAQYAAELSQRSKS